MMILLVLVNDVLVWLNEDYNHCFESHNTTHGNIFEALCFIKGCRK